MYLYMPPYPDRGLLSSSHFPNIGFTNREVLGQKRMKFINWEGLLIGGDGEIKYTYSDG